ncbi:DUF6210 family protein [Kitasatospora sp. NPDC006786]|uniref:DUF6210 family protein n=1 Tax=Kitasatospora sp. NPDC006786 TaxID=3157187 RepID=UPI0033CE5F4C
MSEEEFTGAGTWHRAWSEEERATLRGSVGSNPCRASGGHPEEPHRPGPDGNRLRAVDGVRVPVTTPDGPGVPPWADPDRTPRAAEPGGAGPPDRPIVGIGSAARREP